MMRTFLFMALLLNGLAATTQVRYDYNWFLTTAPSPNPAYGASRIDFNTSPPTLSMVGETMFDMDTDNVSWSDADGNFDYLSNGCQVINADFEVMQNGDSINPGIAHNIYCEYGYPLPQGMIIIPDYINSDKQYLFHCRIAQVPGISDLQVVELLYTYIDMTLDGGLGSVVAKNQLALQDTFSFGFLTAVRHADGERWWLVVPEHASDGYHIVLVDGEGPHLHRNQHIGTVQGVKDWAGQAVFSPDGRFYARADGYYGLEVMEFDRCHGAFYSPRHVELPLDEGALLGAAISPNSRYLYVSSQLVLLQYDLLAPDLAASVDTVGVYDGFESWLPATFFMMQLAPDGKVYMTTSNGTNVLHVVQQPDLPGAACQFEQHAVTLPTYYGFSPPNFPNYRLGPAPENYCDSVTATVEPPHFGSGLELFPNPASEYILVRFTNPTDGELRIVDMQGRLTYKANASENSTDIFLDTSLWPVGLYCFQFLENGRLAASGRFVISR